MDKKAKIITVAGKGGVGKTSISASIVRLLVEKRFENVALYAASFQMHRVLPSLVVDKPLSEVVIKMYVKKNSVHSERLKDV